MNALSRTLAALAAAALFVAVPAWACGGFFCFTAPVDQSAERILYVHKDGKMQVHIQISYTGDDQSFSWVLPLQKPPLSADGIEVSSDTIFQLLEQFTTPQFQLNWKNTPDCMVNLCMAASAGGGDGTKNGGGVQLLMEKDVGPYKAVVIQGDTGANIVKWLNDNKFVQPKATEGLIDTYAKEKFVFLALKLQKDKSAGDLVPIAVTIAEDTPCLPIRLTALATAPDMPIVAWVIDKARAIPKNYLHVEINEAVVDWLSGANNYKTVVTKAVDLGSGHAFLTEMAKKTKDVPIPFAQDSWQAADFAAIKDPSEFLALMFQKQMPRTVQVQGLIRKYIKKDPKYAAVSDQEFYNCIQNFKSDMGGDSKCKEYHDSAVALGFDGAAFAKDLETLLIIPLQKLNADYKSLPYITRLYTTLSANEMTKDPIFAVNPDLPEVSNIHSAEATPICENGSKNPTKAKIKFADGTEITYDMPKDAANTCNFQFGGTATFGKGTAPIKAEGGQALRKVQVLDEKGPPLDIDQSVADKVDAHLNFAKLGSPSLTEEFRKSLPPVKWDPYAKGNPGTTTGTGTSGADASSGTGTTTKPATGSSSSSSGSSGMCDASPVGSGLAGLLTALLAVGAVLVLRRRVA